ncbi:transketolase family protein, partial [Candidatus Uhrbacteria bacterium]|nr:transketolase family protein [Candidatus Uhrbacteria bacterium]
IACGPLVYEALWAARILEKSGVNVMVVNVHTVKPLDEKTVIEAAKRCKRVVTLEEAQVIGGLGGAVAETLARHYPTPVLRMGMQDTFGTSGTPEELIRHFGLDRNGIVKHVLKFIKE